MVENVVHHLPIPFKSKKNLLLLLIQRFLLISLLTQFLFPLPAQHCLSPLVLFLFPKPIHELPRPFSQNRVFSHVHLLLILLMKKRIFTVAGQGSGWRRTFAGLRLETKFRLTIVLHRVKRRFLFMVFFLRIIFDDLSAVLLYESIDGLFSSF